jgi:hypothetical protein
MHTKILSENPNGRDNPEDTGIDGKIILKRILGKQSGKVWTKFIWLRIRTNDGLL